MKKIFSVHFAVFILLIYNLTFNIENCSAQSGWYQLNSGTSGLIYSVFFTNENTGFVGLNYGVVLKTTNAGVNWVSQSLPTTYQLRYVFFTDVSTGYIASGGSSNSAGDVIKTTNGGNTWNALSLPVYAHFYRVYFINSNIGYVTGWETILKTTNAGSTWESQSFAGLGFISHICFVDVNTGFACTYNSYKILKTTNGGSNWQEVFTASAPITGIAFIDANTGTAVGGTTTGSNAFIIRTTNGGNNWTNNNFNNNNIPRLYSVTYLNPNIGYIAGGGLAGGVSSILKTTNGGVNWYFQTTNVNNGLMGSFFTNVNIGYAVGYNGTILKTTDGGGTLLGINPESNQIPEQFSLAQNYPNPFNPSTIIKFDIAKTGFVTLKIYNILGKEIKTLVNEKLDAGSYSISWNANDFQSGVYFYRIAIHSDRIKTEGFSDVKRMILIK